MAIVLRFLDKADDATSDEEATVYYITVANALQWPEEASRKLKGSLWGTAGAEQRAIARAALSITEVTP